MRFGSAEKRESWEKAFVEAKEALALHQSRRPPPEFLRALPLHKTRPGLHFGPVAVAPGSTSSPPPCWPLWMWKGAGFVNSSPSASPVMAGSSTSAALWMGNSDADLGQVAILQLQPDPALGQPTSLTSSRLTAICHVPSARHSAKRRKPSSQLGLHPDPDSLSNLALDSDSSDSEDDDAADPAANSLAALPATTPPLHHSTADSPLIWMATDDGSIYLYSCSDSIKSKLCRNKTQHSSSVNAIAFLSPISNLRTLHHSHTVAVTRMTKSS